MMIVLRSPAAGLRYLAGTRDATLAPGVFHRLGRASSSPDTPRDGAVFVSYASENRDVAQRLADGLCAAGLDVWFDQNALQIAGDWANTIHRSIERCALFLPVVSRESLSELNVDRYFWREWNVADYRARGMAPDTEFIVPVVVDDTRLDRSTLPDSFKRKQGPSLPDGQSLASASADKTLILWDLVKHVPMATLEGHKDTVYRVAFGPDGKQLASAAWDGSVILWNLADRKLLTRLEGHSVTFSPEGRQLSSVIGFLSIARWSLQGRAPLIEQMQINR